MSTRSTTRVFNQRCLCAFKVLVLKSSKLKVLQVARHVVRSTGGVVHTCACATGSICVPHPGVYDVHIYLHSRYMLYVRTCVPRTTGL